MAWSNKISRTWLLPAALASGALVCTACKRNPPPQSAPTAALPERDVPLADPVPETALTPATTGFPATAAGVTFAKADLAATDGSMSGTVSFSVAPVDASNLNHAGLVVVADLKNAKAGEHGFHIHENGACTGADFAGAGSHLNPDSKPHAGPGVADRHAGDLGNIHVDDKGVGALTETIFFDGQTQQSLQAMVTGKSVIVHEGTDDLATQPSGNSGKPIACGVIVAQSETAH